MAIIRFLDLYKFSKITRGELNRFLWSYLDEDNLEQHLNNHGSLNFTYLSQMLTEEDSEDLLKDFIKQIQEKQTPTMY